MNNFATTSKTIQNEDSEDDDIFEDSTFLANLQNSSFKKTENCQNNVNDSLNASKLNVSALCCDEEISGYDKLTGKTWIYPTNYPVRDYQFNIIKTAILKNTLGGYRGQSRSPVKGGFKIPQLPKKFSKAEVLSQFVEDDTYQMDSFCVDSHIGLTQVNDISDLELAEMALEEQRRAKKRRGKYCQKSQHEEQNDKSPVMKRKKKNVKRQIHSDSDESS